MCGDWDHTWAVEYEEGWDGMIYIKLFLSFLQIGAFSIGGGYAALPLIQSQVVHIQHWLSAGEFTDLVTISQMTPGPIAINAATFVGLRLGGLLGGSDCYIGLYPPIMYYHVGSGLFLFQIPGAGSTSDDSAGAQACGCGIDCFCGPWYFGTGTLERQQPGDFL